MAGPPLARLRIELEADSASLETGLQRAQVAFRNIAAVGVAVGNLIAEAFVALARRAIAALGSLTDVTSDAFQRMSIGGQRAGLLLGQAFDRISERSAAFTTEIANRVLPGVASLIDKLSRLDDKLGLTAAAIEVIVAALKTLVTGGAIVISVFEALGHIIAAVAKSLLDVARGDFQAAYDHLSEGARGVAAEIRGTAEQIRNIWTEAPVTPGPGVLGPWETIITRSTEALDHVKRVREEMQNALADPTVTLQDKLAAIQVALQDGAITFERYQRAVRQAYEANAKAMEGTLQTVGQALTALFAKSKPAAIAAALINTYVGITQALRTLPPPWSFIQAAAVGAMGFAQVRNITSTSSTGGGAPSMSTPSAGDAGGGAPSQMLTVEGLSGDGLMSMMSVRGLIERINEATANGATLVLR